MLVAHDHRYGVIIPCCSVWYRVYLKVVAIEIYDARQEDLALKSREK